MRKIVKGTYQGYYAIPYSKNMFGELIVNVIYDPRELDVVASTAVKGYTRVFLPESFLEPRAGVLTIEMVEAAAKRAASQGGRYYVQ